ncbi:MAG: hypothetical protein KAI64_00180 [Thermoplasmata archaeon]|nr:hypothetical protein [Thermoplasmata archaeon]
MVTMEATRKIPISSVKEAIRAVDKIRELFQSAQEVPGLEGGELEDVFHKARNILNTYTDASRRQYRALLRNLDKLAQEVNNLFNEGIIIKKHSKLLIRALAKMRLRDFYSARRILRRFDDVISVKTEMRALQSGYRVFYQGMKKGITDKKARLERLRTVPRPSMSRKEIDDVTGAMSESIETVKRLTFDYISTYPSREVLGTMLKGSKRKELRIPSPESSDAVEQLIETLEYSDEIKKKYGETNLHALVKALGYTDARFAHILKDYLRLKPVLQDNKTWLRALSLTKGYHPVFSLTDDEESIRKQANVWLEMLQNIPRSSEAAESLKNVLKVVDSGILARAKEAAEVYKKYGKLAQISWDGTIKESIEETKEELSELIQDRKRLPPPDEVLG